MTKTVDDVLAEFEKKHGLVIGKPEPVTGLTTGNLAIDWMTGIGGLPIGRITELYGYESSGKAQPLDARVLTPTGYVKMGEIKFGDLVSTAQYTQAQVTGVYPQGVQPVYRLTFSDGSSCEATEDHLWTVEIYVPYLGYVLTTQTTAVLRNALRASRPRVRLPKIQPVSLQSSADLPLDPYLLGLLLGDGGMTGKAVLFTTKDDELIRAVRARVPAGCEVKPQTSTRQGISWRINGIQPYLRELGLLGLSSAAKFVPEIYKHQPGPARQAILQGLMDTDGHAAAGQYRGGNGVGEFYSVSQQLRDDVVWLARSLGLKTVVGKTKIGSYKDKSGNTKQCQPCYRVRIYQTESMRIFALPRKLKEIAPGLYDSRFLETIEYSRDADCQCISIAGFTKLYITDDFIPTHNTTTALQTAVQLQQRILDEGTDERIIYLDFEHALDIDYADDLGLDTDHPSFVPLQPNNLEQGAHAALELIETGKVPLIVFDSVAAMAPQRLKDGDFNQATIQMHRAKLISALCQSMIDLIHLNKTVAVFINHKMESVEMSGRPGLPPKVTTPGGRGLKYYASLRLEFDAWGQVTDKVDHFLSGDEQTALIANKVGVKCVKNKVGTPGLRVELRSRYGRGFDNAWSAIQVLMARKIIRKTGAWYKINTKEAPQLLDVDPDAQQWHGEAALLDFADTNPLWRDALIRTAVTTIADTFERVTTPDDLMAEQVENA